MKDYIEYLNLPAKVGIAIIALYALLQIVGELLEVKGRIVPEFMKVRKYFARKKQERETLAEVRTTLDAVKKQLTEIDAHYSKDNIAMRDGWMSGVNQALADINGWRAEFDKKLDQNSATTLDILIENLRSSVISFASYVIDEKNPVTREQFNRIFKIYAKYEDILKEHKMTNGEANVAMRIIKESYETHTRNHSFVEDIRGYEPHGEMKP